MVDSLLVLVLLTNLAILGSARIRTLVLLVAAQGVLLSALAALVHPTLSIDAFAIAFVALVVKGVLIPSQLLRALRYAVIGREVSPMIDFVPSMILGGAAIALSFWVSHSLPIVANQSSVLVPTSTATVLCGFLAMTSRRKAISQTIGYLVMENGVYVMSLSFVSAMPVLIELGVLLDMLVAVIVFGITIHRISRSFSSTDTSVLTQLHD